MEKREFNPRDHLSKVVDERDGCEKLVLKATARVAWFRSQYPEGKIAKLINREGRDIHGNPAVRVECRVYARATDAPDQFLANGFASRSYNSANEITQHYLECCETAAKIRALIDAGFILLDEDGVPEGETLSASTVDGAFCDGEETAANTAPRETPQPALPVIPSAPRKYVRKLDEADYDASNEMAAAGLVPSTATGQTAFFPEAKERHEDILTDNIVRPVEAEKPAERSKEKQQSSEAAPAATSTQKSRRKKPSLLKKEDNAPAEQPVEAKSDPEVITAPAEALAPVEEPVPAEVSVPAAPVAEEKSETVEAPAFPAEKPVAEEPVEPASQTISMDYKSASKVVINEIASNPNFKGKTLDEIIHMDDENACKMFLNWAAAQNPVEYSDAAAAEIVAAKVVLGALI